MKKGWSAGKIIGVIAGVIAAVIILWIAFIASMFQLVDFFTRHCSLAFCIDTRWLRNEFH